MKKFTVLLKEEWLQLTIVAAPLIAAIIALPHASARVPMQWGAQGQVNWTAPKAWGLFAMPATMVFMLGIILAFEFFDPRRRNSDGSLTEHGKATRSIRLGISVLLCAASGLQIAASLGMKPDIIHFIPSAVGLLFAFLGTLFGKLKRNRYAGFRIPWTLNSDFVWERTHQMAGRIWTITGLIIAISSWLIPPSLFVPMLLTVVALNIGLPFHAAWKAHREEQRGAFTA